MGDLYAPFKARNEFGARSKKDLRVGKIDAKKSYIPSGMNAAQYTAMRNNRTKMLDTRKQKQIRSRCSQIGIPRGEPTFLTTGGDTPERAHNGEDKVRLASRC